MISGDGNFSVIQRGGFPGMVSVIERGGGKCMGVRGRTSEVLNWGGSMGLILVMNVLSVL